MRTYTWWCKIERAILWELHKRSLADALIDAAYRECPSDIADSDRDGKVEICGDEFAVTFTLGE